MEPLVISAKSLGAFVNEDACQRCQWITLHVKNLPYQIFPGIFSSIDSYTKQVVQAHFHAHGEPPSWLAPLGEVSSYVEPPHYSKFSVSDGRLGVTLRGTADGIFHMKDGSYVIADYKTARYTRGQDALMPMYRAQLNGYAYIAERVNMGPVSGLALVYMEPVTGAEASARPDAISIEGFALRFAARVVPVKVEAESWIHKLMQRARAIFDMPQCPPATAGCADCLALDELLGAAQ